MNKTCKLTLIPSGKIFDVNRGDTLAEILIEKGIYLDTPCGGRGFCGKCAVKVTGELSEPSRAELELAGDGFRLACVCRVEGDIVVELDEIQVSGIPPESVTEISGPMACAVDTGTTTIQMAFVDLGTGEIVHKVSFLNPQRRYGHDVMSRISAAQDENIRKRLADYLRSALSSRISEVENLTSGIKQVAITGNTVMTYSFLGMDISLMGVYPYSIDSVDFKARRIKDILQNSQNEGELFCMPVVSAFIGGDALGGGTLAYRNRDKWPLIFIDIGTNGEIMLVNREGQVYFTSCAMGPALEGMNISSGMTATSGAISHLDIDENNSIVPEVIDDVIPRGFCGTGIIDALALMRKHEILAGDGRLVPENINLIRNISFDSAKKAVFFNKDICITQKDVREVQLAKGACKAAVELLLNAAGCAYGDVRSVFIAGSFGENMKLSEFKRLGFLPHLPLADSHFMGNSSLKASVEYILNPEFINEVRHLRDMAEVLDLASHPDFQKHFLEGIVFPDMD